ncbi:hypothetical protein F383_36421 [Gossypium arboreum]|uniref:Uncharacterized protein n=1 Tax=Gossypium arboreum TaxID=29729 RepID=A0A0B0PZ95_GOSAR|nr:hypothetical protein F383_36421 [Gossypium arboreum]
MYRTTSCLLNTL